MEDNGTVFIVDDDQAVREGIADIVVSMGMEAISFDSAEAFLESYEPAGQSCLVLDVRMPGMNGLELIERLNSDDTGIPVVVVTGHADVEMAVEALKLGAIDFIEKPFREEKLLQSVRKGIEASAQRMSVQADREQLLEALSQLTPRERLVGKLLLEGKSDKEAGVELEVSRRAVAFHRSAILEKLSFRSVVELASAIAKFDIEV